MFSYSSIITRDALRGIPFLKTGRFLFFTRDALRTHSDSFRYAKQRKGGRVRSLSSGFTWLPIDKKASILSSKNLRNFFL